MIISFTLAVLMPDGLRQASYGLLINQTAREAFDTFGKAEARGANRCTGSLEQLHSMSGEWLSVPPNEPDASPCLLVSGLLDVRPRHATGVSMSSAHDGYVEDLLEAMALALGKRLESPCVRYYGSALVSLSGDTITPYKGSRRLS